MKIMEARQKLIKALDEAGIDEARREADLLIAWLAGIEPGQLALFPHVQVDEQAMRGLLAQRLAGQPLQYVLGVTAFMGLDFLVGPGVLIPRPDTEILVERALALLQAQAHTGDLLVADICTGSGAIPISLAHYLPQAQLYATDISPEALSYGRLNTELHQLDAHCHFRQGDLCDPLLELGLSFDMLISNPPYVTAAEMAELPGEVCREPQEALFGGEDGLDFYRRLAVEARPLLKPEGYLLLEHGWQQQKQLVSILTATGWQVEETLRDYGGRERVVVARLKGKILN